ncbi:unnamed protein product, partial [Polarella glacialis]
ALSCVIHSFNSAGVLILLRMLRLPLGWSTVGAALFAAHPAHIENIVYIVGRADSLSTSFYLLAVMLYLRLTLRRKPCLPMMGYVGLTLLTIASGLCKEPGFTALFFLA